MQHETEPGEIEPAETEPDRAAPGVTVNRHEEPGRAGTGEPRVDAALRLLDRLPGLPVSDHPELFEQVHAQLAEVLGELDSGTSGPAEAGGN
jgi:hypothetical protein